MTPDPMDVLFLALACPTRRQILDIVKDQPGCGVKHVARFFTMSRIAVMKHLRVLVGAGPLLSQKQGRNRKLYFNCVPIQTIYDRWTARPLPGLPDRPHRSRQRAGRQFPSEDSG